MLTKGFRARERPSRSIGTLVVALEGEAGGKEYRYFEALRTTLASYKPHWLRIVPLPTPSDTHASAPHWVIRRLDEYVARQRKNRDFASFDMLWLVIDVDSWERGELSAVCQAASQKGYAVAASNPCFELWLLLHLEPAAPEMITRALVEGKDNGESKRSQRTKQLLAERATRLDYLQLTSGSRIGRAALRSELLNKTSASSTTARWPEFPGTFVHRVFQDLERHGFLPEGWLHANDSITQEGSSAPSSPEHPP